MLKKSYFSNIIILFIFLFYAYLLFTLFLNFYDKKEGFTQNTLESGIKKFSSVTFLIVSFKSERLVNLIIHLGLKCLSILGSPK